MTLWPEPIMLFFSDSRNSSSSLRAPSSWLLTQTAGPAQICLIVYAEGPICLPPPRRQQKALRSCCHYEDVVLHHKCCHLGWLCSLDFRKHQRCFRALALRGNLSQYWCSGLSSLFVDLLLMLEVGSPTWLPLTINLLKHKQALPQIQAPLPPHQKQELSWSYTLSKELQQRRRWPCSPWEWWFKGVVPLTSEGSCTCKLNAWV